MNFCKIFLASILLLVLSFQLKAQTQAELNLTNTVTQFTKNFPVPQQTKSLLFYLQRNKNTNTIIYEANYLPNGKIDPKNPVSVYWIRYEEGGVRKELNWIQRWLAFGVDFEPTKDGSDNFILTFVAVKHKKVVLKLDNEGKAIACLPLNGKPSRLTRLYAQAQETNWLPTVKFVQMTGEDLKTKETNVEYIFPKQQ